MIKKLFLLFAFALVLSGCTGGFVGGASNAKADALSWEKGKAVKGFPAVPVYPNARILESFGYSNQWGASYISDKKLTDIVKFYQDSLAQLNWQGDLSKKAETNYVFDIKNDKYTGQIIVNTAADNKKIAITISVRAK